MRKRLRGRIVLIGRVFTEHQRTDGQQAVEPSPGLIDRLADKIRGKLSGEFFLQVASYSLSGTQQITDRRFRVKLDADRISRF